MNKRQWREELKKNRSALPSWQREIWDQQITEQLKTWQLFRQARTVMIYLSIGWEINTWPLVKELMERDVEVYAPVVRKNPRQLVPTRYLNREQLSPGDFGILEPNSGMTLAPSLLDLVIVPGLAFTLRGFRIGFGGGYYDRFLPTTSAVKIGLCYSFFVFDLPVDLWDQPVDFLGTEEGIKGRK